MPDYSTAVKLKAFEYLEKENKMLIEDAVKQVEKIEPHYHYLATLSKIFEKFLEFRELREEDIQGVHIARNLVAERTLFIAVVLWLYSPSVYNGNVDYSIENGVRHELEGILLCNETWISQQVKPISFQYRTNYQDFKDDINSLLAFIKSEVKEKAVIEMEAREPMTMFQ